MTYHMSIANYRGILNPDNDNKDGQPVSFHGWVANYVMS